MDSKVEFFSEIKRVQQSFTIDVPNGYAGKAYTICGEFNVIIDIGNLETIVEQFEYCALFHIEKRIKISITGQATYGVKVKPHWRFVWNSYLLEHVDLHPDWLLYITHGFIGQASILLRKFFSLVIF